MAKSSYDDWDTTAGNNLDIGGISIAENCPAANINNAIRELMAQLKTLNIATTDDTPGRLLNIQTFTSSGTYTPTSGTTNAHIKMVGGGGGGGGADSDDVDEVGLGSGGGAGGYVEGYLDVSAGGYTASITIGSGGTAGDISGGTTVQPGDGSNTVYDDGTVTWTAGGGIAGVTAQDSTGDPVRGGNGGAATAVGALFAYRGAPGENAYGSGFYREASGGVGGSTVFGGGGRAGVANSVGGVGDKLAGNDGDGYGSGGGGAASAGVVTSAAGGAGAPGFVIIFEYA